MKYFMQLLVIIIFFYIGNIISNFIGTFITIPGSIIGMLLLFLALSLKIVKLSYIEDTSNFFLKYMGFFFVPLGVSLIDSFSLIKDIWLQLAIILVVSNILVMGFTSKITEILIKRKRGKTL